MFEVGQVNVMKIQILW